MEVVTKEVMVETGDVKGGIRGYCVYSERFRYAYIRDAFAKVLDRVCTGFRRVRPTCVENAPSPHRHAYPAARR
eukprot:5487093-Prymnesium_polylepis.1